MNDQAGDATGNDTVEGFGVLGPVLFGADDEVDEFDADLDDGFADPFGGLGDAETTQALAPPVHWPRLDAETAREKMIELWEWVQAFQARFPEMMRLPQCWPHHNGLVELLQALADYERGSFFSQAPPTAAVSWHLMVRDVEARMRTFVTDLPCRDAPAGEAHKASAPTLGWREDADLAEWLVTTSAATNPDTTNPDTTNPDTTGAATAGAAGGGVRPV